MVIPCTKFHFRRYSTPHNIKKAGAALVRTITSLFLIHSLSLRSRRFRLVSEQRNSEEGDFRF